MTYLRMPEDSASDMVWRMVCRIHHITRENMWGGHCCCSSPQYLDVSKVFIPATPATMDGQLAINLSMAASQ